MDRNQFNLWLQGIISRVSSQQTFFSAIYEPISANNAAESINNKNVNNKNASNGDERPSGLRLASVIGKSAVILESTNNNVNTTVNNTTNKNDADAKSGRP